MIKTIQRIPSQTEALQAIASFLEEHTRRILSKKRNYSIALSGGRTPVGLFKFLCREKYRRLIQWEKMRFFWSDERYVPAHDRASNFQMAHENLLSHLPVQVDNVFRAPTEEISCEAAARKYQQQILTAFSHHTTKEPDRRFYPQFDLIMLGMGEDGHTASLFPNHPALKDSNLIAAVESEYASPPVPRLTFTLPLINNADTVIFMVNGTNKIKLFESFVKSDVKDRLIPASMVAPQNQLIWFVWP